MEAVLRCARVCKKWRDLLRDDEVWYAASCRWWPGIRQVVGAPSLKMLQPPGWRDVYRLLRGASAVGRRSIDDAMQILNDGGLLTPDRIPDLLLNSQTFDKVSVGTFLRAKYVQGRRSARTLSLMGLARVRPRCRLHVTCPPPSPPSPTGNHHVSHLWRYYPFVFRLLAAVRSTSSHTLFSKVLTA